MNKQLFFISLLTLCGIQNLTCAPKSPSNATRTLLSSFDNPHVSEQDLMNFLTVPNVDIHATNNDGQTLLMLATQYGYENLTATLIQNKLSPNAQDNKKRTALMFAAQQGSVNNVNALLNAGANAKLKDVNGHMAKDYALGKTSANISSATPAKCTSPEEAQARYIKLMVLKTQQAQGQKAIAKILPK